MKIIILITTLFMSIKTFSQNSDLVGNCYTDGDSPYGLLISKQDSTEFKGKMEYYFSVVLIILDQDQSGLDQFKEGEIIKVKGKNHLGLPMTYFVSVNVPDPECMDKLIKSLTLQGKVNISFREATNIMGDGNVWNCNGVEEVLNKTNECISKETYVMDAFKNYIKN